MRRRCRRKSSSCWNRSSPGRKKRVINQVALRTMNQARYSPENSGHFALGAPSYGHFTSPIRRYPDLVVHRQLRALRWKSKSVAHPSETLEEIALSSSGLERSAEAAERELLNWKKVAFHLRSRRRRLRRHRDRRDAIRPVRPARGEPRRGSPADRDLGLGVVRVRRTSFFSCRDRRAARPTGSATRSACGSPASIECLQRVDFSLEAVRSRARRPVARRTSGAGGMRRRGRAARRR